MKFVLQRIPSLTPHPKRLRTLAGVFILLLTSFGNSASAQSVANPTVAQTGLVKNLTVMPYLTGSLNIMSGKAFPATATGPGIGGGLTFDWTAPGQSAGLMFDFAFQDMYASAHDGSCINPSLTGGTSPGDTIELLLESANAYHYFMYLLFEPFLKLQSAKDSRGYFIIGASIGMPVVMETYSQNDQHSVAALWNNDPYAHRLRVDLRIGLGTKIGHIGKHDLILEARGGYPVTNVLTDYANACSGGDVGNWRIITFQANLGLRF